MSTATLGCVAVGGSSTWFQTRLPPYERPRAGPPGSFGYPQVIPREGSGIGWMRGVASEDRGNIGVLRQPNETDDRVSERRHHMRRSPRANLTPVLINFTTQK